MNNYRKLICGGVLLLLVSSPALATSFVVPTDEEMVTKSSAILIGTVEGSYVQERNGIIETVYEIRVERRLKGNVIPDELVRVVSPGGMIGERGLIVPATAHFRQGERVLLFLTRDRGVWRTTDLTLGKFRFVTSTAGQRVLVRDMEDVVGWDHAGRVHRENVRLEAGFLRFIEERVRGRAAAQDYVVDAASVTLPPREDEEMDVTVNAPFPAATYTSWVNSQPIRWPNMSAGVNVFKRSDQNISGAADGGVSAIQNGLAAWTNECGSLINLIYAGQQARASANHDGTNIVEYNDPQSRISGSWSGSGTIAFTFLSFAGSHSFNGGTWWNITDADVVFQDGFPATHSAFASAMTHELGHGLGWRHSNQNHQTGGACNSAVEECTSAAIMNSSVSSAFGFNLQTWDINAAQSVYPGGTCGTPPPPSCTPPSISGSSTNVTIVSGSSTTLSVSASGTSLTYQWYSSSSGTFVPVSGATSSSLTVTPTVTTTYYVVVSNACGTATSATITVTVRGGTTAGSLSVRVLSVVSTQWRMAAAADFTGDGYPDVVLQNSSTGEVYIWTMRGGAVLSTDTFLGRTASTAWQVRTAADFNGDGSADILVQNVSTGDIYIWTMNRTAVVNQNHFVLRAAANWRVIAAGRFNNDSIQDLLLQNQSTRQVVVWTMNGLTVANTENLLLTSAPNWMVHAAGDVNGNGYADVILRNGSTGMNAAWLTTNLTVTNTETLLPTLSDVNWRLVTMADFNRDGSLDVLWQNMSTGQTALWYLNGTTQIAP